MIAMSGVRLAVSANRKPQTENRGFTLIEVIMSIAIIAVLGAVVALLMNSIIESWQYTQNRLELQKASSDIINELIQGGFDANGIRDAVDFISCGADSITFLPLWVDGSHRPDPVANKEQKFTLNRQFKVGASIPLAQVKKPQTDDWVTVSVKFTFGEKTDPKRLDDVAQVLDPIPYGSEIKFTFAPDPASDFNTQKSYTWNKEDKHVYKTYNNETADILKAMPDVKVERLRFIYFDNLNQEIPMDESGYLSAQQIKRATAVKIYILLIKKGDWREAASYTNIRNIQGVGVSIIEGSSVPLPSSSRIKAFSVGNFFQRKKDGIARFLVKPANNKYWAIQFRVIPDPSSSERLKIEKFQIESPPGRVLTSGFLNQSFMADEYINLLTLDRTGLYDYDDDDGIEDFYKVTEESAFLEVERFDFAGASLFVRP